MRTVKDRGSRSEVYWSSVPAQWHSLSPGLRSRGQIQDTCSDTITKHTNNTLEKNPFLLFCLFVCLLASQRRLKCCPCDSRNPNGPLAHTLQEVLSTSAPDRWWQSRKGEEKLIAAILWKSVLNQRLPVNICKTSVVPVCPAEESPVTLQLDLNNLYQLDNLVLNFKVGHSLQHVTSSSASSSRSSCYYHYINYNIL